FVSIFALVGILLVSLIVGVVLMIEGGNMILFMLIVSIPMIVVGAIVYAIGVVRMSRPDKN
ncbi:unnamed protein product, partial [marine sediment metagenome]